MVETRNLRWPACLIGLRAHVEELQYLLDRWPVRHRAVMLDLSPPWVSYEEECREIDEGIAAYLAEEAVGESA